MKLVIMFSVLFLIGCNNTEANPESTESTIEKVPEKTKLTKIVFVGKENACTCTLEQISASWNALQIAIGTPPILPIEKLQIDTEPDKVKPYQDQRAIMVLPAIYFVNEQNKVIDMIQGEVTEKQIVGLLG